LNLNLHPSAIDIGYRAIDKADAIRRAGQLLVEAGSCAADYIEAMLQRESKFPTLICDGVAIPHGELAHLQHVHFSLLSVVHLTEPIEWHEGKVELVFGLAARQGENLEILGKVADALQMPDFWLNFRGCSHPDEVIGLLGKH
jgi:mannitol/fructose-specific phosphotransferase system IIA component